MADGRWPTAPQLASSVRTGRTDRPDRTVGHVEVVLSTLNDTGAAWEDAQEQRKGDASMCMCHTASRHASRRGTVTLLTFLTVRPRLAVAVLCSIGLVLASCGLGPGAGTQTPQAHGSTMLPPVTVTVTLPQGAGEVAPFITAVPVNSLVIWANQDGVAHTFTTMPDHTSYLNPEPFALTVPPSGTVQLRFTHPGVYDYYDPHRATWNATNHRVAANAGAPGFPLAMEGVIWVEGPIAGLPLTTTNPIPGKDEYASEFVAIAQGGSVAWYDGDTDDHDTELVPGWGKPINPLRLAVGRLGGTDAAPPNGATRIVTYRAPGLYYYYCSLHADVVPQWHRAEAHRAASEFPIAMEAFVLVAPSPHG
jgi:plastocyanin